MPVTSRAGVTSKAGFAAGVPAGATRTACAVPVRVAGRARASPRPASRSSIGISAHAVVERPVDARGGHAGVERHAVVARRERDQVGADLVAHVAARGRAVGCRRSTTSTCPRCITWPAAVSAISVCGTPARPSSHAVRLAPWLRGRVSSTHTWTGMPRVVRLVDGRERRAPVAGREPARVAVREHVERAAPDRARASRHALEERAGRGRRSPRRRRISSARIALRLGERGRAARSAPGAPRDRARARARAPTRGSPRSGASASSCARGGVLGRGGRVLAQRERQAERGRDADQGRAAHAHGADRLAEPWRGRRGRDTRSSCGRSDWSSARATPRAASYQSAVRGGIARS